MVIDNKVPAPTYRLRLSLRNKLILGFSLISAFASFVTARWNYTNLQNEALNGFKNRLLGITRVAALQQNGDEFKQILSDQDPLYEKFRLQNLRIRNSDPDLVFVYTMRKDDQGIYFVVDAGEPTDEDFSAFNERYFDPSPTLLENFDTLDAAIVEPEFYTDEYGTFLSAYAPILSTDGTRVGVIGVDILADTVIQEQRQIFTQSTLIFLIALGLGVLFGTLAGNALTRPVAKLTQGAHAIASGKFDQRVEVTSTDEVGELAETFNVMAGEIQSLIDSLETRVAQRTREVIEQQKIVARRSYQFESITRVAKTISTARNLQEILPKITQVIAEQFGFYHVGIFLNDALNQHAVLSAANSEGGKKMLARGHQLKIGEQGIVGYTTATGNPRISLDVGEDAVFFNNPDLPLTRSEMALPLVSSNQVVGALDIQSTEANAFSSDDIDVLTALADQVSLAIENSRLFEQTQQALSQAQAVSGQYLREAWGRFPKENRIFGYKYSISGVSPLEENERIGGPFDKNETAVPISLRGEIIGTLKVQVPQMDKISQDQIDLIKAVADRVALSAENARLFDETQRRAERERIITEITSKIGASVRTENILKTTAKEINQLLDGADVLIQLKTEMQEK